MRISQEAFNLIVAEEVTSEAVYTKKYRRPEWPGAQSGATVGIGYDLGQTAKTTIKADWKNRVPDDMLDAMVSCAGKTGAAGRTAANAVRNKIDIPWETAIAVHRECVLPRWEAKTEKALPNTDKLSPDSFGALVSLTFNRGPSFSTKGDRYREMRAIKAHMAALDFSKIPDEFRAMKRLWPNLAGLRRRRDTEAALFERGLTIAPAPSAAPAPPAAPAPHGQDSVEIEVIQKRLDTLGYHEVGAIDGKWGGRTSGAIAAFKNDRRLTGEPVIDDALKAELNKAEAEKWTRPIAKERSEATPAELAPKLPEVAASKKAERVGFWASISGAVATACSAIVSSLGDAVEWLTPLKTFAGDVPWWVWIIGALIGSGVIYYVSRLSGAAKTASVTAYQEGART